MLIHDFRVSFYFKYTQTLFHLERKQAVSWKYTSPTEEHLKADFL